MVFKATAETQRTIKTGGFSPRTGRKSGFTRKHYLDQRRKNPNGGIAKKKKRRTKNKILQTHSF